MIYHLVESAINDLDDNEEYNSSTEEGMYINKITLYVTGPMKINHVSANYTDLYVC